MAASELASLSFLSLLHTLLLLTLSSLMIRSSFPELLSEFGYMKEFDGKDGPRWAGRQGGRVTTRPKVRVVARISA
jgi:hypothetical protein